MKRLLILCYFYPPLAGGGVHRVLGFTRHLPEHGWLPTVVCAGSEDYWVIDETLLARVPAAVEVHRVPGGSGLAAWLKLGGGRGRRSGGTFDRLRALSDWLLLPDSYVGWSRRAARAAGALLERERFDALLSSSPPDSVHLAALDANKKFAGPWIADFRDPWIGLHFRQPKTAWHRRRQEQMERSVLDRADLLIAASNTHAERLRAQLPRERAADVVHLPNGYEPATEAGVASPPNEPAVPRFVVAYTGTMSRQPDAEVFLEAVHDLLAAQPEARRRLRAVLQGPYESHYADRAQALSLTGIVELSGPRPHAETVALQRRADLLVLWKMRGIPTMVPGKLYEYLDAGRPLVAVLEPDEEAAALVRRAGGTIVSPGDRAGLTRAIERHYRAWREGRPVASSRPDWLSEHTRRALTARLAALLDARAGAAR